MKKFGLIILLTAITAHETGQNLYAVNQEDNKQGTYYNTGENNRDSVRNNLLSFEGRDSALNVRTGNWGLGILESLESPGEYNFENYSLKYECEKDDEKEGRSHKRNNFKGHWSGIEFGFNNYLTSGNSIVMPDNIDYMTLHSSKSTNFNINFSQLSLGLTKHIGFVTGLGINWNNYRFDGSNNIVKGINGIIEDFDPGVNLKKSKLATVYLTLPFVLEIQIPANNHHLNIAAGPIGALKLGSHTKMVFQDGQTIKSKGDFSLNLLRYGATARIGYGNFQIYGTYYRTPLFQTGKGPAGTDLYPFEIGVALAFND